MTAKKKTGRGRPTDYTPELGDEICRRLSEGESLNRICRDESMPARSTVITWALGQIEDANEFPDKYALARQIQSELLADEIHDIADDGSRDVIEDGDKTVINHEHIQRSKLRVDTRKWYLSSVVPRFKPKQDISGEIKSTVQFVVKDAD